MSLFDGGKGLTDLIQQQGRSREVRDRLSIDLSMT